MNRYISILSVAFLLGTVAPTIAQEGGNNESAEERSAVTAVYGVTADDYLPAPEQTAASQLNPQVRRKGRQSFDLPDAFYFIGGPIFILILLRVLVIFLKEFEEKRKEEENQIASEHFNPD